jgi:hypothetical protein
VLNIYNGVIGQLPTMREAIYIYIYATRGGDRRR